MPLDQTDWKSVAATMPKNIPAKCHAKAHTAYSQTLLDLSSIMRPVRFIIVRAHSVGSVLFVTFGALPSLYLCITVSLHMMLADNIL